MERFIAVDAGKAQQRLHITHRITRLPKRFYSGRKSARGI